MPIWQPALPACLTPQGFIQKMANLWDTQAYLRRKSQKYNEADVRLAVQRRNAGRLCKKPKPPPALMLVEVVFVGVYCYYQG